MMDRKKKIEELNNKMWNNHIKEYDKVQEQIKKELNISQEELKKLQKEFIEPRYEYTESEF